MRDDYADPSMHCGHCNAVLSCQGARCTSCGHATQCEDCGGPLKPLAKYRALTVGGFEVPAVHDECPDEDDGPGPGEDFDDD